MDDKENHNDFRPPPVSNEKLESGRNEVQVNNRGHCNELVLEPGPLTTKVYYFVDDQATPYSTEVPVPPTEITLSDFKCNIMRRNYKYYSKIMDASLKAEVKAEIRDEDEVLKPNANGRFELFLLTENVPIPATLPAHYHQQIQSRVARASLMAKRTSTHYLPESRMIMPYMDRNFGPAELADPNFASSMSMSEDDSQYTTTDFTSVSQQNPNQYGRYVFGDPTKAGDYRVATGPNKRFDSNNKPYWPREKRKRPRRTASFLSSTFDDTEVSMSLDLITVTFNMDTRRPFGMSVVVKRNRSFYGIIVHEVAPNSLVALDGRIKPGFILLEINGIPLDEYETPEEAVNVLSSAVRQAVETKGQLKLTCARGETPRPVHSLFRPPATEPVRPIDPTAWVQHTNAARGLMLNGVPGVPNMLSAAEMPKSSTMPKTNPKMKTAQACEQSTSPMKPFVTNCGPKADGKAGRQQQQQDPCTMDNNTTSGHSSVECSVGQEGKGGGGIGSALRRLVCIQNPNSSRKRKAAANKRRGNNNKK